MKDPEKGDARTRLLDAAREIIRRKGFTATTVADLCGAAGVTKGAYFHHFDSKEALGIAAAEDWRDTTGALFARAPYHESEDPLGRVLAYIDFRMEMIGGEMAAFTCVAGTMAQEVHELHPAVRDACGDAITSHAATLVPDIAAAMEARDLAGDWTAESLALHTQAVLQGSFVIAKATGNVEAARESVRHLRRYVELLFSVDS
ncbi:TetR/AcrR family transcriptional regulator [Algicella marina]|uniref:TetR/AcrR family transcriptional regulator n=1 Tax=Algicella marina TaxID=2683284 RepID=UPI0024DFFB4F|nr:TetR/AcrR family transcriptional regulator [Algicella marina]